MGATIKGQMTMQPQYGNVRIITFLVHRQENYIQTWAQAWDCEIDHNVSHSEGIPFLPNWHIM